MKKKYIRIAFDDEASYCIPPEDVSDAIGSEIDLLVDGDFETITLSVVEMTEEEYNKLPEFEG